MKPPTGTTPESECSFRIRNGRRLLSKSDFSLELSDTLDLGRDDATTDERWGVRATAMYGKGGRTSR
jgi:hypothetical protein